MEKKMLYLYLIHFVFFLVYCFSFGYICSINIPTSSKIIYLFFLTLNLCQSIFFNMKIIKKENFSFLDFFIYSSIFFSIFYLIEQMIYPSLFLIFFYQISINLFNIFHVLSIEGDIKKDEVTSLRNEYPEASYI